MTRVPSVSTRSSPFLVSISIESRSGTEAYDPPGRCDLKMTEPTRGKKVLVVDDDEQTLKLTARVLRQAGYEVVTRTDVIGTSFSVASERPDLVLIDLNMPLINGDRLASLIQRSIPERPIIVLYSGIDEKVLAQRAADCGADAAIPKGLSQPRFLERVGRALVRAPAPSQSGDSES
jgi:DNA-binding response OmpR family regulator